MKDVKPKIKLWLSKDGDGFFGPGSLRLLVLVEEHNSLKSACTQMGLSYSKGWKIIANMENALGYPVIVRRQGGKFGGGCSVTEAGKEIIAKYENLVKRSEALVGEVFDEIFGMENT